MLSASADWPRAVRSLFLVAMALFVVTIVIGILNGLDVVTFSRDQLLTHVHSGTLGWITLSLFAASAWCFRSIDRRLAWALGVLVPIYVAAFYSGSLPLRAATGTALLIAVLWLLFWAWSSYRAQRSLPALAIALGFTTFTYGAIIGVLLQAQLAGAVKVFAEGVDVIGAHASAMVFSYLILVATGLLEWRILGTTGLPRLGLVQSGGLFVSGILLSGTLLFAPSAVQAAGGLVLLLNLVAIGIFAFRVLPTALRTDWMAGPGRHLAVSATFVVIAMLIFLYVIFKFITDPAVAEDVTKIAGVLLASDHSAFIGVITNLVFGLLVALTAGTARRWAWADQVAFLGTNLGLVVFLVGLISGTVILKEIGAPVMGVSLLVGVAAFAARLWSNPAVEPA